MGQEDGGSRTEGLSKQKLPLRTGPFVKQMRDGKRNLGAGNYTIGSGAKWKKSMGLMKADAKLPKAN